MIINFPMAGFFHIGHLSSCCPHRAVLKKGRMSGRDTGSFHETDIDSKTKPNKRKPSWATSAIASVKIKPEWVCEQKVTNMSLAHGPEMEANKQKCSPQRLWWNRVLQHPYPALKWQSVWSTRSPAAMVDRRKDLDRKKNRKIYRLIN